MKVLPSAKKFEGNVGNTRQIYNFSLTFLKFNFFFYSHHLQVCDISGLSFLNTLALIIFPTGNAQVPADEYPPVLPKMM